MAVVPECSPVRPFIKHVSLFCLFVSFAFVERASQAQEVSSPPSEQEGQELSSQEVLRILDQLDEDVQVGQKQAAEAPTRKLWEQAEQQQLSGKPADALKTARRVLEREREIHGEHHEHVAATWVLLSELHEQLDDFNAAREARQRIIAIQTNLHGANDNRVADARRASAIRQSAHDPRHPAIGEALATLGLRLIFTHDYEESLSTLERALAILEPANGPRDHRVGVTEPASITMRHISPLNCGKYKLRSNTQRSLHGK